MMHQHEEKDHVEMDAALQEKQAPYDTTKVGLIAVVRYYGGPGEQRPVGFVYSRTKRELSIKLKSPDVAEVIKVIRGRELGFKESRHVSF